MSNGSSTLDASLVTNLCGKWPRKITEYEIPDLGTVRCQSLNQAELSKVRSFPAHLQYAAAIASIVVDENGDQTHVVDDETVSQIAEMDARIFDCFVDIINSSVLNNASVESMVKN